MAADETAAAGKDDFVFHFVGYMSNVYNSILIDSIPTKIAGFSRLAKRFCQNLSPPLSEDISALLRSPELGIKLLRGGDVAQGFYTAVCNGETPCRCWRGNIRCGGEILWIFRSEKQSAALQRRQTPQPSCVRWVAAINL
jgi:hypothetical protein